MKKVCMIVPSFTAKGGIATVVSGYRDSELEKKYHIHYIETYCDGGKPAKLGKAILAYVKFAKELIVFKPDLVHIHSAFGASFFRKAPFVYVSSWARIPVVNHIHGSEFGEFYQNADDWKKRLIKDVYSKCTKHIVLSDTWKEQIGKIVSPEKIEIIHNYGHVNTRAIEVRKSGKTVLYLGFLRERKGFFDIPDVVSSVRDTIYDVKFVLAGSGTEEETRVVSEIIHQRNLDEAVCFPGWVRDEKKEHLLEQASVFYLPSYSEGMPMSILEAMGHGLPIVSTNVGGIPRLVEDGVNGYLFKPGDVAGMAKAIAGLLKDPDKAAAMGKESLRIVKENYSLDRHIEQLCTIYESLL